MIGISDKHLEASRRANRWGSGKRVTMPLSFVPVVHLYACSPVCLFSFITPGARTDPKSGGNTACVDIAEASVANVLDSYCLALHRVRGSTSTGGTAGDSLDPSMVSFCRICLRTQESLRFNQREVDRSLASFQFRPTNNARANDPIPGFGPLRRVLSVIGLDGWGRDSLMALPR